MNKKKREQIYFLHLDFFTTPFPFLAKEGIKAKLSLALGDLLLLIENLLFFVLIRE